LGGGENFWCEVPEGQQRLKRKLSCRVLDESLSDCEVSREASDCEVPEETSSPLVLSNLSFSLFHLCKRSFPVIES